MMEQWIIIVLIALLLLITFVPGVLALRIYFHDNKQKEHSVLRNYPLLGMMRYIIEKMGPELRQYLFYNDREGRPFNRKEFEYVVKAGKYNTSMLGYGAERDFEKDGLYLVNSMFPALSEELKMDTTKKLQTHLYHIDQEKLLIEKNIAPKQK
ncbi:ferredoxin-dependent glutamate synthase [Gracilibacillus boraciitolerans JCM 21714]|uniref:Ferredoxin-dependent glutamate synthase n=1 Tax=Gracilibacillus boraciitolerans JCM 21714 TaxID=1298598 RepID=W4VNC5_9BACI|nr:ferredoxin-dependent glutamate synthase [Gracilibacillus boraciitolerans JCM 21714]